MKASEFILIVAGLALVVFLALRISTLETWHVIVLLVALGIISFQFSLRRQMRKRVRNKEGGKP